MNKIREYRKQKGWSQEKLGQQIGATGRSIGYYETGARKMNVQTAAMIAAALETTLNDLFTPLQEQNER